MIADATTPTRPDWARRYQQALSAGRDWTALLRPRDRLFVASAAGEPKELVASLAAAVSGGGATRPLTAYQMPAGGGGLLPLASERLRYVGLFYHPDLAEPVARGDATFLPLGIHQLAQAIEQRRLRFDAALVQTSPPDARGYMSLGPSVDFATQAAQCARVVIAEVNERCPRTLGDSFIHVSHVHAAIETSREPPGFEVPAADEESLRVAERVLDFVPDRATIEIGLGAVMTAVLARLSERRELGLHTGLIIEPMIDLIEAGIVTNAHKGLDSGATVANQCRGSRRLYSFLDGNGAVSMRPALYTHDPRVLGTLRGFRAINSALEVDLLGQVNSEFIGARRVSGIGGLGDFVRACQIADGARSIIALRSTAGSARRSKIVPSLRDGAGATLTADLADVVVTEHGAADLRGLDAAARARAMIAIADPAARDGLERASRAS